MVFKIWTMENIIFQENKFGRKDKKEELLWTKTNEHYNTHVKNKKNDPIPVAERMNYGEEKETKVTFLVLQKVIKDGEHSIILFFNH